MNFDDISSYSSLIALGGAASFTITAAVCWRMRNLQKEVSNLHLQYSNLQASHSELMQENAVLQVSHDTLHSVKDENQSLQQQLNEQRIIVARTQAQNDAQQKRIEALHEAHEDKLATMAASEQRLQTQFENLANKIFEEKQHRYTQQTKNNIEAVLAPFKNELEGFKKQISEQHIREGQERASLKTEILGLKALNQKITEEAAALTNALKGDNKKQGN